jgi:hypothetical protein
MLTIDWKKLPSIWSRLPKKCNIFIPKRENISKNTRRTMRRFLLTVIPPLPVSSLGEAEAIVVSIL